jgi:hypothetical protein
MIKKGNKRNYSMSLWVGWLLRDRQAAGDSFAAVANKETYLNIIKIQTDKR